MEDSKPSITDKEPDWRQHMHSLPSGDRPFPAWVRWLFLAPLFVIAGTFVDFLGGAFLGLSFGIGPEDTGGTVWVVFGFFPCFAIGSLIALIGKWRGYPRASCRAAFYLFTLPLWLFILFLIWKVAAHFLFR
jgi:hypothetical protein